MADANKPFENLVNFKNLEARVANQNCIRGEIKSKLNLENASYHSVQNLLPSRLISRKLKIKIFKTLISPVVLYGGETWSLDLRGDYRLTDFENRELRRIFGPKKEEEVSWRKLRSNELHDTYSSPNIVRVIISGRMKSAGHVARMGEGRCVYRVLVRRPEGKRSVGRPKT
jgi:hypothetical protein